MVYFFSSLNRDKKAGGKADRPSLLEFFPGIPLSKPGCVDEMISAPQKRALSTILFIPFR